MTSQNLIDAVAAVCPETYELAAPRGLNRFVVWSEYNRDVIHADDHRVLQLPKLQLDLYWQTSGDTLLDDVSDVLDELYLPYDLQDIFYDPDYERRRAVIQVTVV